MPKRILIIRTDRIGDVTLSTPVIRALRDAYPDSYIAFMVRPYAREILEGNSNLNKVIIYDKYGIHKGFFSTIFFALRMRKERFDMAIILHPTNRAHIVAFVADIPNRIGFNRKMAFLLTEAIDDKKFLGQAHELEYTLEALKSIGINVSNKNLYVPVKKRSQDSIASKLSERGVGNSDSVVGIHPGASCSSKRWPVERFASLIDKINSNYNVCVVLIAGPEEQAQVAELKERLRSKVADLCGKTTVGELVALLKRCILFISNDSGPVHIATAAGTPNITIFGRKQPGLSPRRWGPTGKNDIVLHRDVGCEVCLAHNCRNGFKCLKAITIDEVFNAVEKILRMIDVNV